MFAKKYFLFVLIASCNSLIVGAGKPTTAQSHEQTRVTYNQIGALHGAVLEVEKQSKALTPATLWQRAKEKITNKTMLFCARHPNSLTDALFIRTLMRLSTEVQFKGEFVVNEDPEMAPALKRLMAKQLIKTVAQSHPDVSINCSQELLLALEDATPQEAARLNTVAVRNFASYMANSRVAGADEGQILTKLMEKNPALAKEFGKAMLANPGKLLQIIQCSHFSPFFSVFAKNDSVALVELAKKTHEEGRIKASSILKTYMTPEQIKAAGLQEAAQSQPAQAAAASVIRSWVSS